MNFLHPNVQVTSSSIYGSIGPVPEVPPSSSLPQQFITLVDVQAMFDLERSKRTLPSLPDPNIKHLHPADVLNCPHPEGYTVPKFTKFHGKQGNARENVVRFIETLGIHGLNHVLWLREFSKSLTDQTYSWYVNLAPNSIKSWEEMVNKFHAKFFQPRRSPPLLSIRKSSGRVKPFSNM